jgi:3-hydroxy-9,10-secoandrosta-1,3,5(10)-triene-9,17-dione monooxygenase reductase component
MAGRHDEAQVKIDSAHFREVLAHLPTGVTVVTAHGADGPVGMTANSFTSVSLDPPLVLLCPARSSTTWPEIRAVGSFCVNVMAGHHSEVTRRFALKSADRFGDGIYEDRATGPALGDALAWLDCHVEDEHEAGDHTIVVAGVSAIEAGPLTDPLVFFRGGFGTFLPAEVGGSGGAR